MIVTCPSCDAKYRAEPGALAARGGRVRCASCAHVWTVDDESLGLAPAELAPEPEPELPKKPHEVIRQRNEKRRQTARAATEGMGWAAVAGLFALVVAAAWLFRVDVVQTFPQTARVYASVGVPVNPHGLDVQALSVARSDDGATPALMIEGEVVNITGRERQTLPLRASLLDASGAALVEWVVMLESPALDPGGLERFHTVLPDPPETGAEVLVELAADETP